MELVDEVSLGEAIFTASDFKLSRMESDFMMRVAACCHLVSIVSLVSLARSFF